MPCDIVGCIMCAVDSTFVEQVDKAMCRHKEGYYVSQNGVRCVRCDILIIQ